MRDPRAPVRLPVYPGRADLAANVQLAARELLKMICQILCAKEDMTMNSLVSLRLGKVLLVAIIYAALQNAQAQVPVDVTAPILDSSSISPQILSPGGTVNVVFRLFDSGGVYSVKVILLSPSNSTVGGCPGDFLSRVSGDHTNATYNASCTLATTNTPNGLYRVLVEAKDSASNTNQLAIGTFSVAGGINGSTTPAPTMPPPAPASRVNFTAGSAIVHTSFIDSSCATLAPSTTDLPNPFVYYLNQCLKVPNSGNVTYFYKPISCMIGGKVEGIVFNDSACTLKVREGYVTNATDRCEPSAFGGFEKVSCISLPKVDVSVSWREPVLERLQLSFRTSHMCVPNNVTRSCLLKNPSFASGKKCAG
jgi:hypothetical protein